MKKIITALTLFCIISVVISCAKRQNSTLDFPKLSMAMDSNPDSVYNVLTDFSGKLSPDDYPLYCFLLVQSIDKTYRHIDTDTLINVAIEYYKHTPDSSLLSKIYYCAGRVYEEMENYPKSIYYYLKSIDNISIDVDFYDTFLIYYYLGNIYSKQELFDEALWAQKKAYQFAELYEDSFAINQALYSLSFAYQDIGKRDSALLCLKYIVANNDSSLMATVYNNIANIYYNDSCYDEALKYIHRSIDWQNTPEEFCYNDVLLGQLYLGKLNADSAILCFEKSKKSDNLYTSVTSYLGLGEAYELKGKYDMSIKYYKKAMLYKDSLEQNEKRIEVLRLDKIYKTEKIKEENYILRLSQLKRKQIAYGFIALLFLSIGVFVWVYYKMKLEREAKIKKQMIILNQEKTRCYQLELERLQRENDVLELKEREVRLRDAFFLRLNSLCFPFLSVAEENSHRIKISEQNWKDIIDNVNSTFDNFTVRLKDRYPLLSEDDIRFCCLLKMRLSLEVLIQIYCIQKQSIYKKKERIKKEKLGIDDNRILDEVICSFR